MKNIIILKETVDKISEIIKNLLTIEEMKIDTNSPFLVNSLLKRLYELTTLIGDIKEIVDIEEYHQVLRDIESDYD